jgi:hypothetical protein
MLEIVWRGLPLNATRNVTAFTDEGTDFIRAQLHSKRGGQNVARIQVHALRDNRSEETQLGRAKKDPRGEFSQGPELGRSQYNVVSQWWQRPAEQ